MEDEWINDGWMLYSYCVGGNVGENGTETEPGIESWVRKVEK